MSPTLVVRSFCFFLLMAPSLLMAYLDPTGVPSGTFNPICSHHFQSVGPFHLPQSINNENPISDPEDIGAAQQVWVEANGDVAYLSTVNGGVWKTNNIHGNQSFGGPHWFPTNDQSPCMSIAALSVSPDDTNLLVAGCGYVSNYQSIGGEPQGLLISNNGAASWTQSAFPTGYSITAASITGSGSGGSTILVSASGPKLFSYGPTGATTNPYNADVAGGIWKSSDNGTSFTNVYSGNPILSLLVHPSNENTRFAAGYVRPSSGSFTQTPVLMTSSNAGTTWSSLTIPSMADCAGTNNQNVIGNVKISAAIVNDVYVLLAAFFTSEQDNAGNTKEGTQKYCFFHSTDSGSTWTSVSNAPHVFLGFQGTSNFAVLVEPVDNTYFYVAGTGRAVFRVNRLTSSWSLISSPIDPASPTYPNPCATCTAGLTAPHSDARYFFWDTKTGNLLLTNDGGVYKRTNPTSTPNLGDWTTLAGDLAITEGLGVVRDYRTGALLVGAQDNSIMISNYDGTEQNTGVWSYALTADGNEVAIDLSTNPSTMYVANNGLYGWFRYKVGTGATNRVAFSWTQTTAPTFPFNAKQSVNPINQHVLVCSENPVACYDVSAFPSTFTTLEYPSNAGAAATHVFGGYSGGVAYPDVIFALSYSNIWARHSATNSTKISIPWAGFPVLVVQHPDDYYINVVTTSDGWIYLTTDFGSGWTALNPVAVSNLLSVTGHTSVDTFGTMAAQWLNVNINGVKPLIVGTSKGVFVSFDAPSSATFTFAKLGANLPISRVAASFYSPQDDVLTVSVLGRGVWQLQNATVTLTAVKAGTNTNTIDPTCTKPLYPNVPNSYGYGASSNSSSGSSNSTSGNSTSSASSSTGSSGTTSESSSTGSAAPSNSTGNSTSSASSSTGSASGTGIPTIRERTFINSISCTGDSFDAMYVDGECNYQSDSRVRFFCSANGQNITLQSYPVSDTTCAATASSTNTYPITTCFPRQSLDVSSRFYCPGYNAALAQFQGMWLAVSLAVAALLAIQQQWIH